jgi:hypothetical protein
MKFFGIKKERVKGGYKVTPLYKNARGQLITSHKEANQGADLLLITSQLVDWLVVEGWVKQ